MYLKKLNLKQRIGMKSKKEAHELTIPHETYIKYIIKNGEFLEIPVEELIRLIEEDDIICDAINEKWYGWKKLNLLEKDKQEELLEDLKEVLGVDDEKPQKPVWQMNATAFTRYLCDLLELSHYTTMAEILGVIDEKMRGLR